jgi:hypothetical protein
MRTVFEEYYKAYISGRSSARLYRHLMKLVFGEDGMANVTHFAPFLPKSSGFDGCATGKCNRFSIYR